ncbi:putative spermidine/putrescine transport system ATP-binding protein [Dongia mobilis]|uniref:Spermidine/putrescine import ATP-binding protein PotA n=1 Tax=Dongia mobilis TaxID=578943 RepID=A0A4R6WRI3_9PROT|nr:ABC transporter ATP-binding protein [Dongia mobilis]TDQ84212.1 putative spermidine/putrescine transport system ATP-binding protein [Dongia mobilis]
MSEVAVTGAIKRYGQVAALDGVDLTFADGEFFGLLGPSGSGKTTLLRAIAGFIALDAGEIRVDGTDIARIPVHKRNIGMVFQNYALFPHMSVAENVAFGLDVRDVPAAEIKARVAESLDLVRLSGLEARRPRQLSGGQQQRVALARALVTRPSVLLLDEPLSALDKHLRQEMQVELRRIQRQIGITTIFVTHDQEEALTLSDRVAIFNQGRVVQAGAPRAVYERPVNRFAAGFLGEANFLEGQVTALSGGEARVALVGGGELALPQGDLAAGSAVLIALRPEKISIEPGMAVGANAVAGRITAAIFSGSSLTYRVAVGERLMIVFEQNKSRAPLTEGSEVVLRWNAADNVVVAP